MANKECPIDWADIFQRIYNESIIVEFGASFLKNGETLILSLKSAVQAHSPEQIELYAHALKGSASNMGAIALAKKAWPLEKCASECNIYDAEELLEEIEQEYLKLKAFLECSDWVDQAKRAAEAKIF